LITDEENICGNMDTEQEVLLGKVDKFCYTDVLDADAGVWIKFHEYLSTRLGKDIYQNPKDN